MTTLICLTQPRQQSQDCRLPAQCFAVRRLRRFLQHEALAMQSKLIRSHSVCGSVIRALAFIVAECAAFICATPAHAAISSAGDVAPSPPAVGGNVAGPLRIGNVDVGTMNIAGGTALTST